MPQLYRKTLSEIIHWVNHLSGVAICVKDAEDNVICQNAGFNADASDPSLAHRVIPPENETGIPELRITFDPKPEESTINKVSDFIKAALSEKVQHNKSVDALSKEIVQNYEEINLFYKLSKALLDITDIKETCGNLLDQALERIPSHKAAILLFEPGLGSFALTASRINGAEIPVGEKTTTCDLKKCVLGEVLETQNPLFINRLEKLNKDSLTSCHNLIGEHSLLAVPILSAKSPNSVQEILGIILLSDKKSEGYYFTSPDLKLLIYLSAQASLSISHWKTLEKVQTSKEALEETYQELMRTYETQQKHGALNEQINMISKRISSTHNIPSIFRALADYAKNLVRADFCIAVYKRDEDSSLHFQGTSGFNEKNKMDRLAKSLGPGPFLDILELGTRYSFVREKDGEVDLGLDLAETAIDSFFGLPILCHGDPMGLIAVFNCEKPGGVSTEDTELLTSLAIQASTVLENASLINRLKVAQYTTMIKLAELAEKRDPETGLHLERMRHYARILAKNLKNNEKFTTEKITDEFVEAVFQSSPLHDIGKVGISDEILLKPGKLTTEEFEVMKKHAVIGGEILLGPEFLKVGRNIALCHHEKYDGTGYPQGLKGKEIPLEARIASLADVFDALTSKRVYKDAFSIEKTCSIILGSMGKTFDPNVVDTFKNSLDEFKEIQEKYSD